MEGQEIHFRKLERMYLSARVNNQLYNGVTIIISDHKAELTLKIEGEIFSCSKRHPWIGIF